VINLTTKATPDEGFLTLNVGGSWDSRDHQPARLPVLRQQDRLDRLRQRPARHPAALQAFFASGQRISSGHLSIPRRSPASWSNGRNAIVQRYSTCRPTSRSFRAALVDVGDGLGLIVGGGYSNRFLTATRSSRPRSRRHLDLDSDFRRVTTDQRIVVNGLVGLGSSSTAHDPLGPTCSSRHDQAARLAQGSKGPGTATFPAAGHRVVRSAS
jgi:hypothetical protein